MLNKFCSTIQDFFKKNKQHLKEKLEISEKLLTIIYQNEEGRKTIVEVYSIIFPSKEKDFRLIVNGTEKYELSYFKLPEKLKEIERETEPRNIRYIYSLSATYLDLCFLNFVRWERLKKKVIKVFFCKENTSTYVIARKTEKANIVHVEFRVGDYLAQEGYVPAFYLKNIEKLKEFLEVFCELEEVLPCET